MTKRREILMMLLFIVSMIFAFWLINFDEFVKAVIGILIINGWFFGILILHLTGRIAFADSDQTEKSQ